MGIDLGGIQIFMSKHFLDCFHIHTQLQQARDKAADDKWQAEFDEAKRQYDQNFGAKHGSDGSDSSSGDKTGGDKTGGYDTHGYTKDQIKALQKRAGIKEDGIWGPDTQKAYEAGYRHDYSPEDEVLDAGDQNHNYGTVAHDLDTLIKGGASKDEQDALLTAAYKAGHINEDQYRSLMKGYRPVLLTD